MIMLIKNTKLICLVINDKPESYLPVISIVNSNGFVSEVCNNFSELGKVLEHTVPAAIIIDVKKDDVLLSEYCFSIKANPAFKFTRIIFVSEGADSDQEVMAFNSGADDFIPKPLIPEAFLKRLMARLDLDRNIPLSFRSETKTPSRIYIDRESFTVYLNQIPVPVSRKEFELLHLMASHPGKIFTRDEIFEKVWKRKANAKDRTIDVHILRLRKKLGEEFISTQKGVGYRFRSE